ncbi:MAG: DUF1194 domain-containing protein [Dinoroseobacter sp.]|nr:DUF1194 domain-containing protein [Dinoroseobacter sp.]
MRNLIQTAALVVALSAPAALADRLEVDVELLLAVDVSRSMSEAELELQRRGYAAALRSPAVIEAIENGLIGHVAVSYVEWAGAQSQTVVVDWMLISDEASAGVFADQLTNIATPPSRRTSISGALEHARAAIESNPYEGLRKVIDISGDGPNNEGGPVIAARDKTVAGGIAINGLPLLTRERNENPWPTEDLEEYYRQCVIGGPASFVIAVESWDEFAEAVRRKLVLELVGLTPDDLMPQEPRIWRASSKPQVDCGKGSSVSAQSARNPFRLSAPY